MLATAHIYGWSPAGDDDDVNIVNDMHFMSLKPFPPSSGSFLSPVCPPLDPPAPKIRPPHPRPLPSTPLTRTSHSIAPSSDRRAQSKRNRDPSWIPRPRNAFIIFRCEYSREHSQGGPQEHHDDDHSTKTLSKRAADAWSELAPSEKERYKAMAEQEREEHARLYPHYRFRPVKRQTSARRLSMSCDRVSAARAAPESESVERAPDVPSTGVPSVMSKAGPSVVRSDASESAGLPIAASPFVVPSSYPVLSYPANVPLASGLEFEDTVLFCPSSPEATLSSAAVYPPPVEMPESLLQCNDAFGLDPSQDVPERMQALEAYAMGLYDLDTFSPFTFPEYG